MNYIRFMVLIEPASPDLTANFEASPCKYVEIGGLQF